MPSLQAILENLEPKHEAKELEELSSLVISSGKNVVGPLWNVWEQTNLHAYEHAISSWLISRVANLESGRLLNS